MKVFILFCFILSVFASSPEEKGLEIAKKSQEYNNGFVGEQSTMEMFLINATGEKIERRMTSIIKEIPHDGDKSLLTFLWPKDVNGTKMLTWTHKESDDDQWLYLPSLKKVKRISSRSKTGSFMGSEFTYEDLGSQEIEKYQYKYINDEKINSRETWKLDRIPKNNNSGYSKQTVWMDKEYLNPVKIDYFDRKNEILKTAIFSGFKKIKKWWKATEVTMNNHQTLKKSVLKWKDRKVELNFSDKEFNKRNLKK